MLSAALLCLSMAVYFEGRNQDIEGQIAIANVVMNRVKHPSFPNDICSVVKEGGTARHRCQFSFYCDGKSDKMTNTAARDKAVVLSLAVLGGAVPDNTGSALFYHADYVTPLWASEKELTAIIGTHLFYKMP